jgi:hypothetical protein
VEGFTISGARNKLDLDNPEPLDANRQQAIKTLINDLEDVLDMLKKL